MRKRVSKRRWIARTRIGMPIPKWAILDFDLHKRFEYRWHGYAGEFYVWVGPEHAER